MTTDDGKQQVEVPVDLLVAEYQEQLKAVTHENMMLRALLAAAERRVRVEPAIPVEADED